MKRISISLGDGMFSDYVDQTKFLIHHNRLKTAFNLEQIMDLSKATYNSLTNKNIEAKVISDHSFLLGDFSLRFLNSLAFRALYADRHVNAAGVAFHFEKRADIKEDDFVNLIGVVGHEVGHLTGNYFLNSVMEEAKAYAFSLVWTKEIAAKNPELMKDYEAESTCPVFYSEEDIAQKMAHDAGYEIHNNPSSLFHPSSNHNKTPFKNPYESPAHDRAREVVVSELKKGISAIELYCAIVDGRLIVPDIAQTGVVGYNRGLHWFKGEKEK